MEFADRSALRKLADEIEQVISRLAHSFSVGNAIKNGVPAVSYTHLVSASKANIELPFQMATAIDLAGRDVFEAVQDVYKRQD